MGVSVGGDGVRHCAYQFGAPAPSSHHFSAAATVLALMQERLHSTIPCWVLETEECVTAFDDVTHLAELDFGAARLRFLGRTFFLLCVLLIGFSFHLSAVSRGLGGCWDIFPSWCSPLAG